MRPFYSYDRGFTLTEILVSFTMLLAVWLSVLGTAVANRKITSYAKHKVQAIYLAQQKIEALRVSPFPPASIAAPGETVLLDDMATIGTADDLLGHRIVTVTTLDTYRKRVQIEINWNEPALGSVGMARKEYLTAVIANEPTMN